MRLLDRAMRAVAGGGAREHMLVRTRGQSGDPSKVKSYDRPKSPHEVELEEDLPPGVYKLQQLGDDGNFGAVRWTEHLFGDEAEIEEAVQRARRAERTAEAAAKESRSNALDLSAFDDPDAAMRFAIRKSVIENEELMGRPEVADRVFEWAFGGGASPDVGFELESAADFAIFKSIEDPEFLRKQVRAIGSAFAEGAGGGEPSLEGLIGGGAADEDASEPADGGTREPAEEPAIETGADLDLAPGVSWPADDADAAESAGRGPEPSADQEDAETAASDEDAGHASGKRAAADGGAYDSALEAGMDALDEEADPEDGRYPGLADASEAIEAEAEGDR